MRRSRERIETGIERFVGAEHDGGIIGCAALAAHGFSAEDAWDIGAIAAFFALSNRMAAVAGMRPNDEFGIALPFTIGIAAAIGASLFAAPPRDGAPRGSQP